jgi:hypothetical protein
MSDDRQLARPERKLDTTGYTLIAVAAAVAAILAAYVFDHWAGLTWWAVPAGIAAGIAAAVMSRLLLGRPRFGK